MKREKNEKMKENVMDEKKERNRNKHRKMEGR